MAGRIETLRRWFVRRENAFKSLAEAAAGPFRWNYDRGEVIADVVVHTSGVMLGIVGAVAILILAAIYLNSAGVVSVAIYAGCLLAMLGLSAAYNLWPVTATKWLLRRCDHSAIYLLIAGTYTPFLLQLPYGTTQIVLLAGVWSVAIAGVVLKLGWPGRFDGLAIVGYLLLGWSGIVAWRPIIATLPKVSLILLAVGGVLYSSGVIFHVWEKLRFQNAIWHAFVLSAACCHYGAVITCVTSCHAA